MGAVNRAELCRFLDDLLDIHCCADSSNNGLQVEGAAEINSAVFGVDACAELFRRATALNARFVFVHHGMSWKDSLRYLSGLNASRLALLFNNDISLYAAHLPLDRHPEAGHNACIADMLELRNSQQFFEYQGTSIGRRGELPSPMPANDLVQAVNRLLDTDAVLYGNSNRPLESIGIVSGDAPDAVEEAWRLGLDCLITGEMDHSHWHVVKETGVTVIAAGHYRTETPGVVAVMERVKREFNLDCEFCALPTGL